MPDNAENAGNQSADAGPAVAVVSYDERLLARIAAGDRGQPLTELYRRYEYRLYALGLSLFEDAGLAAELVQATFVRLWQVAGEFDPAAQAARDFLFGLAKQTAVDIAREPSTRMPASGHGRAGEAARARDPKRQGDPGQDGLERTIDDLLEGVMCREALGSLLDQHREVLELSRDRRLKQREVAAQLGLSLGTVKIRTYYGLRALKLALAEQGVEV